MLNAGIYRDNNDAPGVVRVSTISITISAMANEMTSPTRRRNMREEFIGDCIVQWIMLFVTQSARDILSPCISNIS